MLVLGLPVFHWISHVSQKYSWELNHCWRQEKLHTVNLTLNIINVSSGNWIRIRTGEINLDILELPTVMEASWTIEGKILYRYIACHQGKSGTETDSLVPKLYSEIISSWLTASGTCILMAYARPFDEVFTRGGLTVFRELYLFS